MNKQLILNSIKFIWVLLGLLVLVKSFHWYYITQQSPESTFMGVIYMLVLSFPSGLLVVFLINAIGALLSSVFSVVMPDGGYFTIFIIWLLLFTAGYFQWFIATPYLIGRKSPKAQQSQT